MFLEVGKPCPTCGQLVASQLDLGALDERPRSHRGDPDTSGDAARKAWPRANTQRREVLRLLHEAGPRGLTGDEINEAVQGVGTSYQNGQRRLSDLKRGGWACERRDENGVAIERRTRAGAWARVYVLSAAARNRFAYELTT